MADGSARVPEVLSAAELEGFFAGFVTDPLEPALVCTVHAESHFAMLGSLLALLYNRSSCLRVLIARGGIGIQDTTPW